MNVHKYKYSGRLRRRARLLVVSAAMVLGVTTAIGLAPAPASAQPYYCGTGTERVETAIDFGCRGTTCANGGGGTFCGGNRSALIDVMFAIIRFLSAGVGLLVIGSIVFAGIQYTSSRGDPQASAAAIKRIQATLGFFGLYLFLFAILNFLTPAGFFQ